MAEKDPHGKDQHAPGAKLDLGKNRLSLVLNSFCRAILAVGKVGTYGANKYTDNGWVDVPNGVQRYTDAMYRHLMDEARGEVNDRDTNIRHAAHAAWNALARLELLLREDEAAADAMLTQKLDSILAKTDISDTKWTHSADQTKF